MKDVDYIIDGDYITVTFDSDDVVTLMYDKNKDINKHIEEARELTDIEEREPEGNEEIHRAFVQSSAPMPVRVNGELVKRQSVKSNIEDIKTATIPFAMKQGDAESHNINIRLEEAGQNFDWETATVFYDDGGIQYIDDLTFTMKKSATKKAGLRNFEVELRNGDEIRRTGKIQYKVLESNHPDLTEYDKWDQLNEIYIILKDAQTNESQRILNEDARQFNEGVRENNENERIKENNIREGRLVKVETETEEVKEDLLAHKEDYAKQQIVLENKIINGDFGDGKNAWGTTSLTSFEVDDNVAKVVTRGAGGIYQDIVTKPNHIIYVNGTYAMFGEPTSSVCIRINDDQNSTMDSTSLNRTNEMLFSSAINTSPEYSNYLRIYVRTIYDTFRVKEVMFVDLSQVFGKGNEPDKEKMDLLIDQIGWFDGERTLTQKEILNWQTAINRKQYYRIEQLENAITELGGTI